jgi:hypothetical protein
MSAIDLEVTGGQALLSLLEQSRELTLTFLLDSSATD